MNRYDEQYKKDQYKSDEELRREIDRTRERVRGEAEQLSEKLTADHFKEEAKRTIKEKARGTLESGKRSARRRAESALGHARDGAGWAAERARYGGVRAWETSQRVTRDSPIPVMVGAAAVAGLSWWLFDRRRRDHDELEARFAQDEGHRYRPFGDDPYYPLRGPADQAGPWEQEPTVEVELEEYESAGYGEASYQERAERLRHGAKERGEHLRHEARERAEHARSRLREGAERMKHAGRSGYETSRRRAGQARDKAFENPLAAGAVAVLAGIGIGMLLPRTRREDELLGSRRDGLLQNVKQKAGAISDVAMHGATQAVSTARELAHERLDPDRVQQRVQHHAQEAAREMKQDVKDISRSAMEAGKEAAKEEAERQGLKPTQNGNGHRFS